MKRFKSLIYLAVVAIVVAVAVFFVLRVRAERAAPEETSTVVPVERRTLEVVAEASGLVEPIQTVEVKSRASGEVLRVQGETGDVVAKGTLLAEIDPRDVQNALDQAEADIESARVRLATTEADRRRLGKLREAGLVSDQEVDQTVDAVATARAALVRAQTNLQLARERRNDVTIRAPIAGTLIQRTVEPGQIIASATSNVSGGTTLFTMADLAEMQVRAKVDEVDIGQIHPGQAAEVTVEAYPNRVFAGEVMKIEPQAVVEQNVTLFPVLVHLDNPERLLRPGMNAEVSMKIARREDVTAVPNAAVVSPRDARAAAAVLGVDATAMGGRSGGGGGAPGAAAGGAAPGAAGAAAAGTAGASAAGGPSAECRDLFAKLRAGGGPESLSAAERSQLAACRQALPAGGGRSGRRGAGGPAAAAAGGDSGAADGDTRPAVVFVETPSGPEARRVLLGLSDWEYTEVVRGLEPGERVILISVAQLQQQQQQLADRIRQRAGGGLLGGSSNRSGGNGGARQGR